MSKYMNSAEKAEDNRSSAWTLLILGGVGLAAIILILLGVIPMPVSGVRKIMFCGVLGVLCVVFVVMGFVSFRKAKTYTTQAKGEKHKESDIIVWFKENCSAEMIDGAISENLEMEELSEEEVYFRREAAIKQLLYTNFPDTSVAFLEHMVEEVYEALYEE